MNGRSADARQSADATTVSENVTMDTLNQAAGIKGILWWSSTEESDYDLYVAAKAKRPKMSLHFRESDVTGIREFHKGRSSKHWKDLDVQSLLRGN